MKSIDTDTWTYGEKFQIWSSDTTINPNWIIALLPWLIILIIHNVIKNQRYPRLFTQTSWKFKFGDFDTRTQRENSPIWYSNAESILSIQDPLLPDENDDLLLSDLLSKNQWSLWIRTQIPWKRNLEHFHTGIEQGNHQYRLLER